MYEYITLVQTLYLNLLYYLLNRWRKWKNKTKYAIRIYSKRKLVSAFEFCRTSCKFLWLRAFTLTWYFLYTIQERSRSSVDSCCIITKLCTSQVPRLAVTWLELEFPFSQKVFPAGKQKVSKNNFSCVYFFLFIRQILEIKKKNQERTLNIN